METFCWEAPSASRQLVHARLALAQAVEQADPQRLADDAEAARDQLDELVRKRMGQSHAFLSSLDTLNSCIVV